MLAATAAADTHLLIVSGLSGEPRLADAFHEWAVSLKEAARDRYGLPAPRIVYLAEKPARDPARIDGVATRDAVRQAITTLAQRSAPGDFVMIVLLGHGSSQGDDARFNLPGPDMTAADFAAALVPLEGREVAFVNAASASGDFVKALAGKGRVVVTATRSGMERNETVFGRYFVQAFAGDGADADKDDRVSVLEAFDYARRQTARFYEEKKRLATEHSQLEDGGSGLVAAAGGETASIVGGTLARRLALVRVSATASDDPVHGERRALEVKIEALKARKDSLEPEAYANELETLLLELARKNQAARPKDPR